jgi:hypothetical protein
MLMAISALAALLPASWTNQLRPNGAHGGSRAQPFPLSLAALLPASWTNQLRPNGAHGRSRAQPFPLSLAATCYQHLGLTSSGQTEHSHSHFPWLPCYQHLGLTSSGQTEHMAGLEHSHSHFPRLLLAQQDQQFSAFFGTQMFVTVLRRACDWHGATYLWMMITNSYSPFFHSFSSWYNLVIILWIKWLLSNETVVT